MGVVRTMLAPPRRSGEVGVELSLLVLSVSSLGLAAVDLASGAVVRAGADQLADLDLRPYDVVSARLADGIEPLDPTQPEAVSLAEPPTPVRRIAPRRADRWLRPLLHPERSHLLGFAGPSIPFWELDGRRPSIALLAAPARVAVGDDGLLRCRFLWLSLIHDLPVAASRGTTFPNDASHVVVALTPPVEGHCYKVVTGVL
jgi:hypothetical protein